MLNIAITFYYNLNFVIGESMDLYCIGEILIDFTPGTEANSYIRNPGGAPTNVAIAAQRNGLKVVENCMVGDDDFGHFLLDTLKENNVIYINSRTCKEAITTLAFVTLYPDGNRSFTFARKPGADIFIYEEDVKEQDIENTLFVHAGSLSLTSSPASDATLKALKLGHEMGKIVSFDINYRDMLWNYDKEACAKKVYECLPYIDLLKVSDEEVDMIGSEEAVFSQMEKYDLSLVVETLGPNGARGFYKNQVIDVPGRKANAIDGTGAGDAFWGGFLSRLSMNKVKKTADLTIEIIRDAMNYGNIAGWLAVQKKGAIPSLPDKATIENYL